MRGQFRFRNVGNLRAALDGSRGGGTVLSFRVAHSVHAQRSRRRWLDASLAQQYDGGSQQQCDVPDGGQVFDTHRRSSSCLAVSVGLGRNSPCYAPFAGGERVADGIERFLRARKGILIATNPALTFPRNAHAPSRTWQCGSSVVDPRSDGKQSRLLFATAGGVGWRDRHGFSGRRHRR